MVDATTAWILALAGLLLGALVAGVATYAWLRRRYGDRESVAHLRREYDAYRKEVRDHFVETAKRIDTLTHAYKDTYDHLERGASRLVGDDELRRRVEDATSGEPVTLEGIGQRRLHGPGVGERDGAPDEAGDRSRDPRAAHLAEGDAPTDEAQAAEGGTAPPAADGERRSEDPERPPRT